MRNYTCREVVTTPATVLDESETNTVVSLPFSITHAGSRNLRIKLTASSVTSAAGITMKLQHASATDATFITTTKSTTITTNGDFYLVFNVEDADDQGEMPLMPIGRVVVTTGAGDAVTVDSVIIMQGG